MKFLNEKEIVEVCSSIFASKNKSVLQGIGDDAAVLKFGNRKLLATTDSLQEKIHFDWKYTSPYFLGRKALAVNLSDIAAMGGKPLWALLSIAIPSFTHAGRGDATGGPHFCQSASGGPNLGVRSGRTRSRILNDFFRGLQSCAKEFGVSIVGGDTDHSLKDWKITITLLGEVENPICRKGAKVGDDIWVTGFLGCSALGLEILRKSEACFALTKDNKKFIEAHLNPPPRVLVGGVLSKNKLAHAMIDVSDGLLLDLERLCEASKVGAEIEWENIPLSSGFVELCQDLKKNPKVLALSGGEDYELLFTAPVRNRKKIESLLKKTKTPICRVGKIISGKKVRVLDKKQNEIILNKKGYSHF